jgi:hypothetical protein
LKENAMATIVVKDLTENVELDRQAMLAVVGGARTRGQPNQLGRTAFRNAGATSLFTGLPLLKGTGSGAGRPAAGMPRK